MADKKIVVVLGPKGSGKTSLLGKMGAWRSASEYNLDMTTFNIKLNIRGMSLLLTASD